MKKLGLAILEVAYRVIIYVIFVSDKAITIFSTSNKISFLKFISNKPVRKKHISIKPIEEALIRICSMGIAYLFTLLF